jgi:hypothetical protein
MTVAQLKALLEAVPDDAVILVHHEYSRYRAAKINVTGVDASSIDSTYALINSMDKTMGVTFS